MAANGRLISSDKHTRAVASAARAQRRSSRIEATRAANDLVYRGGAKLTNPVVRNTDPAYARQFRTRSNPNRIKKA